MTTHTLTGNLDALNGGETLTSPAGYRAKAWIEPFAGSVTSGSDVMVGPAPLVLDANDAFTVTVPDGSYRIRVRYFDQSQRQMVDEYVPETGFFNLTTNTDLSAILAADAQYAPVRGAINHGDVSGPLTLSAEFGVHRLRLIGDTTITPTGPEGADMYVRVLTSGTGNLILAGATWDTNALVVPGTMHLTNVPVDGWRAIAVAPIELVPVTPAAVTFSDGTNTITVPGTTGVQYLLDGDPLAAGAHPGYAEGDYLLTWAPLAGYTAAPGHAGDSWSHHFPVPTGTSTDPVALGDVAVYWNPNLASALTLDGGGFVTACDDAGPNDLDLAKSGAGNISTTTVNSKTAILFDGSTKAMNHTSFPSGQGTNQLDVTHWIVVKILNVDTTSSVALEMGTKNETTGNTRALRHPPDPAVSFIQLAQCYSLNEVLLIACTKPASGAAKLWVRNLQQTGVIGAGASVHAFVGGGTAQFALCAAGVVDRVLTNGEFQNLRAWAIAQWGAS